MVRPSFLLRGKVELAEAEHAISIYRDQLTELDHDLGKGLISEEEKDAAEQEIERRALRAARSLDGELSVARRAPWQGLLAAGLVAVGSLGLYAAIGNPGAVDQPLEQRRVALLEQRAAAGDLGSKVELLVERTREDPESFEDWWLLARSYSALGDHASAADAYLRAAGLSGDRPAILSAYAESLTLANGNRVPTAARLVFSQVLSRSEDPRARYYLALAKAQEQDFEGALADWLALLEESNPDAPWVPTVRRDIVNMTRFLERELREVLPDATEAERLRAGLASAPSAPARASAQSEAAALEAALANDPKDWEAWIRLAEIRAASGELEAARGALDSGRANYADAPFVTARFTQAADRLGLNPQAPASGTGPRGPSDEDVAAAAQLTPADRDVMVRGMVESLSTRLETQPNDLQGWLMLIRSYAVLQDAPSAESAVARATEAFESDPETLRRIIRLAQELGVRTQ
jgi:cytochrome c-type biogenesis protein CcmH